VLWLARKLDTVLTTTWPCWAGSGMCCCAFPLVAVHGLAGNALTALQKALRQGTPEIHHSDQGV